MPPEFRGGRDTDPPLRRPGSKPVEDAAADGLRVEQPFSDDAFGDYQARRKEPRSSFGLVAGLVIGVAAVGGIGWYMWSTGALDINQPNGPPQLVKANPDPYKVKPENPGGMHVENQDKLVYDRVAKGDAPPRVENLLPLPEEPKAPPRPPEPAAVPAAAEVPTIEAAKMETAPDTAKAAPGEPEITTAESNTAKTPKPESTTAQRPAEAPRDAAKATVDSPPPVAAKPAEPAKPELRAAKAAEPEAPEQDPLAAAVLAATGGREAATGPIVAKPSAIPAAPAAAKAEPQVAAAPPLAEPTPSAPTPSGAIPPALAPGSILIQLASARSEEGAMGEWNRIVAKNKELLEGLAPNVARVDLAEKGVFFRLRAGPVADRAAADRLCAALSAQNVGCIVVRP